MWDRDVNADLNMLRRCGNYLNTPILSDRVDLHYMSRLVDHKKPNALNNETSDDEYLEDDQSSSEEEEKKEENNEVVSLSLFF